MFIDLPPQIQERVVCSISAAIKYQIPANIVIAVAEKEAGKIGQWVRNTNGTYDVGPMQLNTAYLKELAKYGIKPEDVAQAGCYPYELAAWRLRGHIRNDKGDLWTKVANYHSRTPMYNTVYRNDLVKRAVKWADWLDARVVTYDVTKTAKPPMAQSTARTTITAKAAMPIAAQVVTQQQVASKAMATQQSAPVQKNLSKSMQVTSASKPQKIVNYVPRQIIVSTATDNTE